MVLTIPDTLGSSPPSPACANHATNSQKSRTPAAVAKGWVKKRSDLGVDVSPRLILGPLGRHSRTFCSPWVGRRR